MIPDLHQTLNSRSSGPLLPQNNGKNLVNVLPKFGAFSTMIARHISRSIVEALND